MTINSEGFAVADVDESSCISCGACLRVCPFTGDGLKKAPLRAYAFQMASVPELKMSASGGAFYSLAQEFVKQGGYVCSAIDDIHTGGAFCLSNRLGDIGLMRGSKYYYIDLTDEIIKQIKDCIVKGRKVLFCGLPCQVYAVRRAVGNSLQLTTVDLVCQGAPSAKVLDSYRRQEESRRSSSLVRHSFRVKDDSYNGYTAELEYEDGFVENLHGDLNLYTCSFQHKLFLRESCYRCPFGSGERVGDVTIGDFWGLGQFRGMAPKGSVSLILVNKEQAMGLVSLLANSGHIEEHSVDEAIRGNAPLREPCKRPKMRSLSFRLLELFGFRAATSLCYPKYFAKRLLKK